MPTQYMRNSSTRLTEAFSSTA